MEILERTQELRRQRRAAALVTVVETHGSTPRKPGARMLVLPDGEIEGSIGGGAVERAVIAAAIEIIATEVPRLVQFKLTTQLAMCCGGQMTFFVEPIVSNPTLIVFGCGHVGSAIIYAAAALGFDIVAVDDLEENANPDRLPHAGRIVTSYEPSDLGDLPFGSDTYVVIATRDHGIDQKLLETCAPRESRYLGVIGSARKARMQRERLAAKDFAAAAIERIHCPIGLDIGAQTPEEIAVSVCAELVAIRRGSGRS